MENTMETTPADSITIHSEVELMKLVQFRASEIHMTAEDAKKKYPKLVSQQMPFYMRRRSVSHNIKRMPKRLREKRTETEVAGIHSKKTKRPSRKYRRRPGNLLAEYTRRQKKNVWLETHIWFAKRFKVTNKWGYKIAVHPNDKSIRAAYRATTKYCIIQDLSYYGCLEISGPKSRILEGLSMLTSPECGLTFAAKAYASGTIQGQTMLFKAECYPYNAIGPVKFHWMPSENERNSKLWIWCHPICLKELQDEIVQILKLSADYARLSEEQLSGRKRKRKNIKETKDQTELKVPQEAKTEFEIPEFRSIDGFVKMLSLKDTFNRFHLTGPLAQAVVTESLRVADVQVPVKDHGNLKWWQTFYANNSNLKTFKSQKELWHMQGNAVSPGELPPASIIGLTVRDPRMKMPEIRKKVEPDLAELTNHLPETLKSYDPSVSQSPIWDLDVRKSVKETKIPEYNLNKLKQQQALGLELDKDEESRIPILLVQQPGLPGSGFTSGWDVIIPSSWAMPFWISFIYHRARAAGLRELRMMSLESGQPFFPDEFPDTISGQKTSEENRKILLTKHFRYPPDKRPNFEKLGVLSPFYPQWQTLITEWKQIEVIKGESSADPANSEIGSKMETELLEQALIETAATSSINLETSDYFVIRSKKVIKELKTTTEKCTRMQSFPLPIIDNNNINALVFVSIKCLFKGTPEEFAQISLPEENDFFLVKRTNRPQGPQEKKHEVTVKEKAKTKSSEEIINKIPEIPNLVESCNFKIIGYIVSGGFLFTQAQGAGLGFCTYTGIIELFKRCQMYKTEPMVLIRAQDSYQYRYARLCIAG